MSEILERLQKLSPAKRALLEKALLASAGERAQKRAIPPRSSDVPPVLSFAEQRLWFLDQLQPHNPFYNMPMAAHLVGPFDESVFVRCLQHLVGRHETLHTSFPASNGSPQRAIAPALEIPIERCDLRGIPPSQREAQLQRRLREEARKPFDLATGPLLRTVLFRGGEQEWVVLLAMHHIISDGWSMAVMLRELAILYDSFCRGQTPALPPLEIPTTAGLRIEPLPVDNGTAKYDLTLFFSERSGQLLGSVEYQTALFDAVTIDRMIGCYVRLLEAAADDPGRPIRQMPLLDEAQRRQVLVEFNATTCDEPQPPTLHAMFEEHALRTPERVAIRCGGRDVSYGELNRQLPNAAPEGQLIIAQRFIAG